MRPISGWTVPLLFALMAAVAIAAGTSQATETAPEDAPPALDAATLERIEQERVRATYDAAMTAMDVPIPGRETDPMVLQETTAAVLDLGPAAMPFLEYDLDGPSPGRFAAAAYVLGRLDDPRAEAWLRAAIERRSAPEKAPEMRELIWTVVALAQRRPEAAFEILLSSDPEVGRAIYTDGWSALEVVAVLVGDGARGPLLERAAALAAEADPAASIPLETTIHALARLADPSIVEAVAPLASGHPSFKVRRAAVRALTAAGTEGAIDALLARLRDGDEDPRVRYDAADGIRALRPEGRTTAILAVLESLEGPYARGALYDVLAEMRGEAALPALVSHRGRPEGSDRVALVGAAGRTGSPEAIRILREGLADADNAVALRAVQEIGRLGTAGARETLLATLNDPREVVRTKAVTALVSLDERRAAPRIADRLIREELGRRATRPETRTIVRAYGEALIDLAYADAVDDIRSRIERQGDPELKTYLRDLVARLTAIRDLGDDVEGWTSRLADDDGAMRRLAIDRLAALGSDASVAALVARFDDADLDDRLAILAALGDRGDGRAWSLLERVLLDPAFDIAEGPLLRAWAAWGVQETGDERAGDLLDRAATRRDGVDGAVLLRLGVVRGAAAADRIDGYRATRLTIPYWFRGAEQDRLDALVRDLRGGRGADRYRERPREERHP